MSIWAKLKALLTIDEYFQEEIFSLGNRPIYQDSSQEAGSADNASDAKESKKDTRSGSLKKPLKTAQLKAEKIKIDPASDEIYHSLEANLQKIKQRFYIPPNADVIIREVCIPCEPPLNIAVIFLEGLSSRDTINAHVLIPLMLLSERKEQSTENCSPEIVLKHLLPGNQVELKDNFQDLVTGILSGTAVILMDGFAQGLVVETKGWEHRTVGRPSVENVVRGPQEAFVEHLRVNTALIRKRIRRDNLITEMFKVGKLSNTDVALFYLEGLTNPKLVTEVRNRVKAINTDYLTDTGSLEQFIEDNPYGIIPGQLVTERPDRVAAFLTEGHIALVVDGDPFVLIMPVTFWGLLHSAEDSYIRWPYAFLLRSIRVFALFFNLLLPSFFIAIINYHPEMIPTDLLLSIAASRETIPFPAIWELVMMEISFELIREAGIRIPSIIGPTLGIVGALILGQAAVQANIISPLMVIIVALTGLGSFAVPNYSLSLAIRALRFVFLGLSAFLGFYGLAIGVFVVLVHICGQKSLGVPILSPVTPFRQPSGDVIFHQPIWKQSYRPSFMRPRDLQRQALVNRPWDPGTEDLRAAEQTPETQDVPSEGGNADERN